MCKKEELKFGSGRVVINRNICDNAPECSGIEVCPSGALYWDETSREIAYDRSLCIDCGACADENAGGCPVGAILWGKDDADYEKKWREVEEETRSLEELVVERYGAMPIADPWEIKDVDRRLAEEDAEYVFLEFFCDDTINCLLHSIPVSELLEKFSESIRYFKVQVDDENEAFAYHVETLPALVIYRNNSFVGVVNGYYDDSQKEEFVNNIKACMS